MFKSLKYCWWLHCIVTSSRHSSWHSPGVSNISRVWSLVRQCWGTGAPAGSFIEIVRCRTYLSVGSVPDWYQGEYWVEEQWEEHCQDDDFSCSDTSPWDCDSDIFFAILCVINNHFLLLQSATDFHCCRWVNKTFLITLYCCVSASANIPLIWSWICC